MTVSKSNLTAYELSALDDAPTSPYRTPPAAIVHLLEGDGLATVQEKEAADVFTRALWRVLAALGHLAAKSVRGERLDELRRWAMRPVQSVDAIARLDLWEVDEAARWVMPKYGLLGALAGLTSGGLGLRGAAVGKGILVLLAMRQIHEHAMRYGFDIDDPEERTFAVQVLVAALSPRRLPHQVGLGDLAKLVAVGRRATRVAGLLDVARGALKMTMGTRRRRRPSRASRLGPVAAALGMAAYGVWLLRGVGQVAAAAYRERFVARKHHVPIPELRSLTRATFSPAITSSAQREASPPDPCERNGEARRASAPGAPPR